MLPQWKTRILGFTALVVLALVGLMRAGFVGPYTSLLGQKIHGILPSDTNSNCSVAVPAASTKTNTSSSVMVDTNYPVCLLLTIGDDSPRPNAKALPYQSLYRLFDFAKAELMPLKRKTKESVRDESPYPTKLLVVVDYATVACRMARDYVQDAEDIEELTGVELHCVTQEDLNSQTETAQVTCETAVVGESTRYVDQLKPVKIRSGKIQSINLDESDPSHARPSISREEWRPTIVTAFSSNHFEVGMLLLRSVGKAGKEAAAAGEYNISIVVYVLEDFSPMLQGLLDCVVTELKENYRIPIEVRKFNFLDYPSWMRINQTKGYKGGRGEYAWKAVIVHSVLVERGFVLWTDAGGRFEHSQLVETLNYARDHGFATRESPGNVPDFVHPGMLSYFRYAVDYDRKVRNCDASGIGFTLEKYAELARPWYDCSVTRQCIAPQGSNRENHRQDQAALTLLADITGNACAGIGWWVYHHMDYHEGDVSGTNPTPCYKDPLKLKKDWA